MKDRRKHLEPSSGHSGRGRVGSNGSSQKAWREGVKLKSAGGRQHMVEQSLERVTNESRGSQRQRDKWDWKSHQERGQGTFFFPEMTATESCSGHLNVCCFLKGNKKLPVPPAQVSRRSQLLGFPLFAV